eukprot:Tbor_TRINITY_DN5463_c0_g1::TRINITY_DN5463_c0_g1_i1::g.25043::m.25043/K06134/COQ7; ubiquinone biosynthesis monooxygenase Coq7
MHRLLLCLSSSAVYIGCHLSQQRKCHSFDSPGKTGTDEIPLVIVSSANSTASSIKRSGGESSSISYISDVPNHTQSIPPLFDKNTLLNEEIASKEHIMSTSPTFRRFSRDISSMLRVDLAGEMAAVRICEAQLAWMSPLDDAVPIVEEILKEEIVHRSTMEKLTEKHFTTPSALDPFFWTGAMLMGGVTSLMGKNAVMCCHAAVEEVIAGHYNDQLRDLNQMVDSVHEELSPEQAFVERERLKCEEAELEKIKFSPDKVENEAHISPLIRQSPNAVNGPSLSDLRELRAIVERFRDEELHHQKLGEDNGSADAPFYSILYPAIRTACNIGIFLGKRY